MGRPGPARRGAAAPPRPAGAGAGHPAGLRRRPAPRDARPPDRGLAERPAWPSSSRSCSPRCGSASTSSPTSTASPRTPPSASRSSSSSASSPGGAELVNAVLRRAAREAAARVAALSDATPAEAALRHSHPEWIAALWWDALGRRGRARAARRRQRAGRGRPARQHAARRPRRARGARCRVRQPPAPGLPEALVLDGAVRRLRVAAVGGGPLHAPVARRDDGRPAARPAARRARARPVRRAGRQDDPPRRADGGRGARVVAVERHAGRADALRRTAARMGAGDASRSARRTPPAAHERAAPTTACSSTRPARTSARSRRAPTRAGASPPDPPARLAREQAAILRAGRRRAAPRRHARLLHVHDLARRERGAWSGVPRRADGLHGRRPALRRPRSGSMRGCRASCRPSRTGTGPTGSSSRACAGEAGRER